jgi:hypothetical protein
MLTRICLMVLIADQLYTWSDGYQKTTRSRASETPQRSCASTAPARIDSPRLPHRAIQTMWQAGMQVRGRARTWPQVLSVRELSRPATADGLRAAGGLWAGDGVSRELSPKPRDSGNDLRDQPRAAAPPRGAVRSRHGRIDGCCPRLGRYGIGQRYSRQYARRLARRQPGEFILCGGSR